MCPLNSGRINISTQHEQCTDIIDLVSRKFQLYWEMSLGMRKPTIWVLTRSNTNQSVQSQKIARSLKFCMKEEERLYYPCSENKGTDQPCGYRKPDLHLWFCTSILQVFLCSGSNNSNDQLPFSVYEILIIINFVQDKSALVWITTDGISYRIIGEGINPIQGIEPKLLMVCV